MTRLAFVASFVLSTVLVTTAAGGPRPLDVRPSTHECFYRDDLFCEIPKDAETDIFGCESDGYYTNVHRAYFPKGHVMEVTVQSPRFRAFIGISRAGRDDFFVTAQASRVGGSAFVRFVAPSDGRYEFWTGSADRLATGAYTITLRCPGLDTGPPPPPACSTTCTPDANTACMLGGRFKTTMTWKDASAGLQGAGRIITLPGVGDDQVFWSMYPQAPNNIELVVRMVDGRGANGYFWTSAAAFAVAEYTVTIQDTKTCKTWQRTVPAGSAEIVRDAQALPAN